jgi:hypothetical protein
MKAQKEGPWLGVQEDFPENMTAKMKRTKQWGAESGPGREQSMHEDDPEAKILLLVALYATS